MMIQHVSEFIPAYALGCLDKEEAERVSAHLAGCTLCREELRAYNEVVGELALSVRQETPSADVKARLMKRAGLPSIAPARQERQPSAWQRFLASLRMAPGLVSVSLGLVLVLLTSNIFLWAQVTNLKSSRQLTPFRTVAMVGTENAPGSTGMMVVSLDGEHGTLVVDNLPALDQEHQYQLWLVKDGKRDSGAVFSVGKEGYGSVWVNSPKPLSSYQSFGITIEPAGGSPGPTGEKVMGGGF